MSIVNAFHDDSTVHGAQLVFTTHDPILLDGSVTYALSDCGTSKSAGMRRGEDLQRSHSLDRYGGIRDVDLVPFLREQVERGLSIDLSA